LKAWRLLAAGLAFAAAGLGHTQGLDAQRLGVVFNLDDATAAATAQLYAGKRSIPAANLLGIHMGTSAMIAPESFAGLRSTTIERLPTAVQSLLLVWSKPFAVGCMSITTAFAAGYRPAFCQPGCAATPANPLFDSPGWLPADTVGWWPSMLLPTADPELARAVIERGIAADGSAPSGTLYLIDTQDAARNVRAAGYSQGMSLLTSRVRTLRLTTPIREEVSDVIGYFTGVRQVEELPRLHFRPGAVADHLTSAGGVLSGGGQMSAIAWLKQGATASYGTVSEPCNHTEKFPNPTVLFDHYLRGETLLEAYWKSVAMPGQGLFIGEPLARPYANRQL
jgi:uncharacterized protein (TIGR03790 family)